MRSWFNRAATVAALLGLVSSPAFAQNRIDQLGSAAAISATDTVPICQGCNSSTAMLKATLTQFLTFLNANLSLAASRVTSGQVAIAQGGTSASSAAAALTALGAAPIASPTFTGVPAAPTASPGTNTTQLATTAYVLANASGASLGANNAWTAGQAVTPTTGGTQGAGGTLTPNFALSNSITATFGAGNLTIANPSGVKVGQNYIIALTQDGTGSRTVTWGSQYKWQGGTPPTLSTAASAKDIISCYSDTTTTHNCVLAVKGAS